MWNVMVVEQAIDYNTLRLMRSASWIPKAINTHSEHVILIDSILQQWLGERTSMVCYTCLACPD